MTSTCLWRDHARDVTGSEGREYGGAGAEIGRRDDWRLVHQFCTALKPALELWEPDDLHDLR
jgi:hypothetical protein